MIAAPLFFATLALAPTGEGTLVEGSASAQIGHVDATNSGADAAPQVQSNGGGVDAGVTLFFDRVVDDDAAPSLQPYLQRVASFGLSGGGYGYSFDFGPGTRPVDRSGGGLSVGMNAYFGPHKALYAGAGFSFRYQTEHTRDASNDVSSLTLPLSLTFGVRFGDVRVRAAWTMEPERHNAGPFVTPFYGNVSLHGYAVVRRRLELTGSAYLLEGGGSGSVDVTLWLARRFGLSVGANGGHERVGANVYTDGFTQDFAGGWAGFTSWLTSRFAVYCSYAPEWRQYVGPAYTSSEIDHYVTVGLTGRPF
jgi:hypothetical protein